MSLDTKVKNLIINTNMTKEQYEAVDDKSNQLFFVEDSSVVDVPAPEENQSGYLHTDGVNLTWKEVESGGSSFQVTELPDPSLSADKVLQYVGGTNTEYTHGFFYEYGDKFIIMPTIRGFDMTVTIPSGIDTSVVVEDQEKFLKFITRTVMDNGYPSLVAAPTNVNIMLDSQYMEGDKYPVTIIAGDGEIEMQAFFTLEYLQQNTGISGLNDSNEFMVVDIMVNVAVPGSLTEGWQQVDVQPSNIIKIAELVNGLVELATNTIYNGAELQGLSITFPTVDLKYTSQLNFTSGASATSFTAPDDIKWAGDSIVKGAFVPEINKRYVILFYYDGVNICAIVRGE